MPYSNGFDTSVVLPALKGRIGWQSETGQVRNFESFHALCTEQNLKDVRTDTGDFTAYKDGLQTSLVQRVLSSVFNRPEYIEQVLLHNRIETSPTESVSNSGKFVGIRFRVAPDFAISTQVKSLSLLFDGAATFNVYLYKVGTPAPIKTQSVTTTADTPVNVDLTDWIMSYGKERATTFYVGYFQDDLGSVKAIREQVYMNDFKCFSAYYFETAKTGTARIDQSQTSFTSVPYGLTAEVHSFRDYTQKIVRMPYLFDEAIGLSMVYFLLEQIVSTTRSNATERILKGSFEAIELKHYLYGAVPAMGVAKTKGLNDVLNEKFETIRQAFNPTPKSVIVDLC
jgi:hypothetical protein